VTVTVWPVDVVCCLVVPCCVLAWPVVVVLGAL